MNKIYPLGGLFKLFKQTPGRMADMEAVQAGKKGVLIRLNVVLK